MLGTQGAAGRERQREVDSQSRSAMRLWAAFLQPEGLVFFKAAGLTKGTELVFKAPQRQICVRQHGRDVERETVTGKRTIHKLLAGSESHEAFHSVR